ncbi:MAG: transposase [Thermodesulfobacteriota bacterium]|nr:transposase [Thermodesulfobacteriota bacterium]
MTGATRQLASCHGRYHQYFQRHTVSIAGRAFQYLKGLFQADKKNLERIEKRVPEVSYDPLQYFLSDADWDWRPINDQIAADADKLLGGHGDSALYIDETGLPKKGKMSVGVSRQWCGRFSTPIDTRLYLPKNWTDDKERCKKAKIPVDEIVFKTMAEQALEMVFHARKSEIRFNWVGFDGFYGSKPEFLRALADNNETFMADVHKDQHVYLEDPRPIVPVAKSKKGLKPTKLKAQTTSTRVDKLVESQPDDAWKRVKVRETTKGKLIVDILHKTVWLWDEKEKHARLWHLVVRREIGSPNEIKYSLSNAISETSVKRLAYMQAQRYWVERPFQDAKNECGMGDYQARGWLAWYHHMTMVMMAMLFMIEQRLHHQVEIPLLSCADITTLLKSILPRRDVTEDEILRQLQIRHKKRQASIDHEYKKQWDSGVLRCLE